MKTTIHGINKGIKAGHVFITDNCRKVQGPDNVFDVACERLKEYYNKCVPRWPEGTTYHVVLIIERGEKKDD